MLTNFLQQEHSCTQYSVKDKWFDNQFKLEFPAYKHLLEKHVAMISRGQRKHYWMFLRMKQAENVKYIYVDSAQLRKKLLRKILLTKQVKHSLNPNIKYQAGCALIRLAT